jgi:hypothetical protein
MSDLLYHYTSEAGLSGIIENDNLRATHVRCLNDWMEFREALNETYVRVLLDSFRAGLPLDLPADTRLVIDGMVSRRAPEILEVIVGSDSENGTFVCSFTSASSQDNSDPGDRLSQWRAYASAAQGFSLGFDKDLVRKRIEIDNPGAKASLQECIYDEAAKVSLFEEMGRAAASRFNEPRLTNSRVPDSFLTIKPDASEEYKRSNYLFLKSLALATANFFTAAARIKHASFSEEREWRVIFQAKKAVLAPRERDGRRIEIVKFRDGQFGPTPYIEIPLGLVAPGTSPLRRIVMSPGVRKEEGRRFIERLLRSRGIEVLAPGTRKGVQISASLIPYRSA